MFPADPLPFPSVCACRYTACTCVNEDLAPKRRVEVLRKFYRTHAKDKLDGAKALADKKKTTSKFAKLLVKLVAKCV